ncbi:MAG: ABC transporter substrate-binding protein [Rhodobiaceae bacterium]|nr:ABC transporter substrate-binding protein [Rhodobiaceae bacterium]
MKLAKLAAIAATALTIGAGPAFAELVFPSLSYRTGPYAPNGIPFADGYADYFTLINERDGGIEGQKIKLIECETGYNTEKGVECYESARGEERTRLSAAVDRHHQLIEGDSRPYSDHSMGYGRTSAASNKVFRHVFNYPSTYWDAASIIVKYISSKGGDLKGEEIALVYPTNSATARDPSAPLEELSKTRSYELLRQSTIQPGAEVHMAADHVMWGWGVSPEPGRHPEAANIRFPMDHFIGVWW